MGQKLTLPDFHAATYQAVIVGLDNAGKSTTLYRLKLEEYVGVLPTIGFNCERVRAARGKAKGAVFVFWDVGGQEKLRALWRSYLRQTDVIVVVVDSADDERFEEIKTEVSSLLRGADVPAVTPLLLLANKQDMPKAKAAPEVEQRVGVADLAAARPTRTLACCAITGEGLEDAFDVMLELIVERRKLMEKRSRNLPPAGQNVAKLFGR